MNLNIKLCAYCVLSIVPYVLKKIKHIGTIGKNPNRHNRKKKIEMKLSIKLCAYVLGF